MPLQPLAQSEADHAVRCLSTLERRLLWLNAVEGLDAAAIAQKLAMRPRRVARILARAIRKFDRALAQDAQRRPRA